MSEEVKAVMPLQICPFMSNCQAVTKTNEFGFTYTDYEEFNAPCKGSKCALWHSVQDECNGEKKPGMCSLKFIARKLGE